MSVEGKSRFYEAQAEGHRRSAPAALRNRDPIAAVLKEWLPARGLALEIASGTGEHALHFARLFPNLTWQPSDPDSGALASIAAWAVDGPPNILPPLRIDAGAKRWPVEKADVILNINMAHISPWAATLGLLDNASRLLPAEAPLIFYGPWFSDDVPTAPSNAAFDKDLRSRNPDWGLRRVEDLEEAALDRGLSLDRKRQMPANNLMLRLLRKSR